MNKTTKIGIAVGVLLLCFLLYFVYQSSVSNNIDPIPRPPCNQSATTTDCSKIIGTPTPPAAMATTSSNPVQSGKIDEHLTIDNTLREVNFCGKIFRAKQVIIDEVDVVQRIAELATKGELKNGDIQIENGFCKYLSTYMESKKNNTGNNSSEIDISEVSSYINDIGHGIYNIFISSSGFAIDITNKNIYSIGGYDGSLNGPVGKL